LAKNRKLEEENQRLGVEIESARLTYEAGYNAAQDTNKKLMRDNNELRRKLEKLEEAKGKLEEKLNEITSQDQDEITKVRQANQKLREEKLHLKEQNRILESKLGDHNELRLVNGNLYRDAEH
jgi:hypothetical protein